MKKRGEHARQLLCLALLPWLLAGCERAVFESAPAASGGCDATLVGHWLSVGDGSERDGEFEAIVAPGCQLTTIEHKAEHEVRSEPTQFSTARVDRINYLWLDAGWSHRSFEVESTLLDEPGDIYLLAYRQRRDTLELSRPALRSLAHKVLDKDVRGEVLLHDDNFVVRVSGDTDVMRAQLRRHRIFRFDDTLRFRRAPQPDTGQ